MNTKYDSKSAGQCGAFIDQISGLDLSANHAVLDGVKNKEGFKAPDRLEALLGHLSDKDSDKILDTVQKSVRYYHRENGCYPTGDVLDAAFQQAQVAFNGIAASGAILDNATSAHHDQISLQPNRAQVAIMAAIAEAIPFAAYLPVDIGSNEGRLAIMSHRAGSTFGDFASGDIMDGVKAGGIYASAARMVRFDVSGAAPYASKFTQTNLANDRGFCDASGTGVPVLRGRTMILVNGKVAATEPVNSTAGTVTFSGSVDIGGTTFTVNASVVPATGVVTVTTITGGTYTGLSVTAVGYVDYEASPALTPKVSVQADVFPIYANPWHITTSISQSARTQLGSELGLDGMSESMYAIRTQMALERHYYALRLARELAKNNTESFNFDYANQMAQKTRAQVWQDFAPVLGKIDQKMANDTMDHGVTHIYAPSWVVNQWRGLPSDLFTPSGIESRAGIYRAGKLFGKYDVYYSPEEVGASNGSTAELLCIGRSSQVARCPIVLGDAVPPSLIPIATGNDFNANAGMYARDFTVVNPHGPSSMGAAKISLSNMVAA